MSLVSVLASFSLQFSAQKFELFLAMKFENNQLCDSMNGETVNYCTDRTMRENKSIDLNSILFSCFLFNFFFWTIFSSEMKMKNTFICRFTKMFLVFYCFFFFSLNFVFSENVQTVHSIKRFSLLL